jgi:hypothetical protein
LKKVDEKGRKFENIDEKGKKLQQNNGKKMYFWRI